MSGADRRVTSADGTTIAVHESGNPDAPAIVLVHGYPDNHAVWDGVVDGLGTEFHVVTYDVRGCGDSDKPTAVEAYRLPRLVEDFRAVAEAVSPHAPVHLVGHDWGAVQSWAAVLDQHAVRHVATFSSISGPSLDMAGAWLRDVRSHPRASLRQLAHSYYLMLFQLPKLPEFAVRRGVIDRSVRRVGAESRTPRPLADQLNGLSLYRANMLGRMSLPAPSRTASAIQVIVPDGDPFITPELAVGAARAWCDRLTVTPVAGGHWVVSQQPELVARLLSSFARTTQLPTMEESSR